MSFQTSCSIVHSYTFKKLPCRLETIWYLGRVDLGRVGIWDELVFGTSWYLGRISIWDELT